MDRFKWYPKSFYLTIICQDAQSLKTFCKAINDYNIEWDFIKKMKEINIYIKQNKRIDIITYPCLCNGRRANAIIFDDNIPINVVEEIILPMANIEPSYSGIAYKKNTLEKNLTNKNVSEKYEIDLEDN